jgi:two-component system NtrC family sensor kinase
LGDTRFAGFLFDLPAPYTKKTKWGYFALFISMTGFDSTQEKLRAAMIYVTALLVLSATLLIFILSNRIVRPIELLVLAMKRVKASRVEHIPTIDAPIEIEYLIHSFNEMSRSIVAARHALEDKVEELHDANHEIKNAQGTLVQSAKMISLGQIVAGVAHELNNPIGFIYSNMHHLSDYIGKIEKLVNGYRSIQEKLSQSDKDFLLDLEKTVEIDFILKDMEELTRSCLEGAKRTKEIVLGLRTFSRVEDSDFEKADLHEGIRNTLKLLKSELRDKVVVHEEFGEIPLVECNLSQMNQVFMNLLSNAIHAIVGKGDIWVRTSLDGENVKVEIEDNGSGMSKDHLDKVFDPFFTTKKVGEGTGLGLSIAYGLVQKHRGDIQVESVESKGTVFRISLPIHQNISFKTGSKV